jgi:hemimethylated DNA binding protein
VIQRNILGPENLLPLGANMVRKAFRAPTQNVWKSLSEGFATLRELQVEVRRLPKALQPVKYKVGTMFRHKAWAFVGIIYSVDPICLGEIKPEVESKLEHGRYQPFYRVLIDDHSDFSHYVAQEWVEVIPARKMTHPKISEYFEFKDNEYVPISAAHDTPTKENALTPRQEESGVNVSASEVTAMVAELTKAQSKASSE